MQRFRESFSRRPKDQQDSSPKDSTKNSPSSPGSTKTIFGSTDGGETSGASAFPFAKPSLNLLVPPTSMDQFDAGTRLICKDSDSNNNSNNGSKDNSAAATPESDDSLAPLMNRVEASLAVATDPASLLNSPSKSGRSRSFDSAAAAAVRAEAASKANSRRTYHRAFIFLELPKWRMLVRKTATSSSSSLIHERDCFHCQHAYELAKRAAVSPPISSANSASSDGEESDNESTSPRVRTSSTGEPEDEDATSECIEGLPTVILSLAPEVEKPTEEEDSGLTFISLEVPIRTKSGRSASVDSSYLQVPQQPEIGICELPPVKAQRSRSIDVALPVGPDGPYIVVPTEKEQPIITQ
uniref:Eye-specific diacylglycerol kinase n=1 Tax=Tetranychus urticae TaxID=32264 RepID=T1L4S2_TETUR